MKRYLPSSFQAAGEESLSPAKGLRARQTSRQPYSELRSRRTSTFFWYALLALIGCYAASSVEAAELKVPATTPAGQELKIPVSGSGNATLYLFGPGSAVKRDVNVSGGVTLSAEELKNAGRYTVVVGDDKASFFVTPNRAESIAFIARPSRVPAARPDVISGTAFIFDKDQNLVTAPTQVRFDLAVENSKISRTVQSKDGVAWIKLPSARTAGAAQFTAALPDVEVRRVVQLTASDPCNINMKASPSKNGILVETAPIRDCAGNPVPDGTIVTFSSTDANGKSTVDARIKKGIARAELQSSNNALISVASGVVVGNEIRWGGAR
jgi:hypothetical protein